MTSSDRGSSPNVHPVPEAAGAAESLCLVGDGDEVEILEDIERAFEFTIAPSEAERCETVGHVYDIVLAKMPRVSSRGEACLAAVAFYRLRGAVRKKHPNTRITPSTHLSDLIDRKTSQSWWSYLEAETELRLPPLQLGWPLVIMIVPVVVAVLPLLVWLYPLGWIRPHLVEKCLHLFFWPLEKALKPFAIHLPPNLTTIGDLARVTGMENIGRLSCDGRVIRKMEVWDAILHFCRHSTGFEHPIGYNTRFF